MQVKIGGIASLAHLLHPCVRPVEGRSRRDCASQAHGGLHDRRRASTETGRGCIVDTPLPACQDLLSAALVIIDRDGVGERDAAP